MALDRVLPPAADDECDLIPFVVPSYAARVRRLVAKFEEALVADPTDHYARCCLAGWQAELKRIERNEY